MVIEKIELRLFVNLFLTSNLSRLNACIFKVDCDVNLLRTNAKTNIHKAPWNASSSFLYLQGTMFDTIDIGKYSHM